jgi:hypothetical protein
MELPRGVMADHLNVDPVDLHMSAEHMDVHHSDLQAVYAGVLTLIASVSPTASQGDRRQPHRSESRSARRRERSVWRRTAAQNRLACGNSFPS